VKVGLIGIGTMGSRMCEALVSGGFTVIAWDIRSEAQEQARRSGAKVVASPAETARDTDIAILMSLPWPKDVEEVVTGSEGILAGARPGQVVVDLSTVDPMTTRRMAAASSPKGVGYIDAPVLGRPQGCGKWTLPCGGSEVDLKKVQPVLDKLAKRVVHVGSAGSGNIVKLLNNLMFGAINSITAEVMAVCAKVGMNPRVFFDTVAGSGAATVSNLFLELGPQILAHNWEPKFSVDLLYKDNLLGIAMGQEHGAPMPISQAVHLLNEMARAKGYGQLDTCSIVRIYEDLLKVSVKMP